MYLGNRIEDSAIDFKWSSNSGVGASVTRATNGTVSVYKSNNTTQTTAGVTDTEDFDSLTGIHHCRIDTSADAFYVVAEDYQVVLSAATIDGQVVNAVLASFCIDKESANVTYWRGQLVPAPDTAGYPKVTIKQGTGTGELDLTSGRPGIDLAKVSNPTTTLGLSGTTVKAVTDRVTANTDQIAGSGPAATNQSKAALCIGRITVGSGSTATNIVTSAVTPAVIEADQYKGRVIIFDADTTTTALRGQQCEISANTSGGEFTVSTLTELAVSGDTGSIL